MTSIYYEPRSLKPKRCPTQKENASQKRPKSRSSAHQKSSHGIKPNSKAKSKPQHISKAQMLKSKIKEILSTNLQIKTRAAIVIQRWYRCRKHLKNVRLVNVEKGLDEDRGIQKIDRPVIAPNNINTA